MHLAKSPISLRIIAFMFLALSFVASSYWSREIIVRLNLILIDNVETTKYEKAAFNSEIDQAVLLSPRSTNQQRWVRFEAWFRATGTEGYPNLMQTAPLNEGIRLEMTGSTLALIFKEQRGTKGQILADNLELETWHKVRLTAVYGSYVEVELDGKHVFRSDGSNPVFEVNEIRIGEGFGGARKFKGELKAISFKCASINEQTGIWAYIAIKALLVVLMGLCIRLKDGVRDHSPRSTKPAQSRISGQGRQFQPLLLIRAYASYLVLFGHLFLVVFTPVNITENLREWSWINLFAVHPWIGVWVFFTLSGYLMGKGFFTERYILTPNSLGLFFWNRALRIAPVYLSAVLLVAVLKHPEIFQSEHIWSLGKILLFDHTAAMSVKPIGALWSISTEVQFYLLTPMLFWGLAQMARWRVGLAAAAIGVAAAGIWGRSHIVNNYGAASWIDYAYLPALSNADLFLTGMVASCLVQRFREIIKFTFRQSVLGMIITFAILHGVGLAVSRGLMMGDPHWTSMMMLYWPTMAACLTVVVIVFAELTPKKGIQNRTTWWILGPLQWCGIASYCTYVWHEPILLSLRTIAPTALTGASAIILPLLALIPVFIVSGFMYYSVERPFEEKKVSAP